MWACDFYNIRMVYHFGTKEFAEFFGKNSGFQFTVYRV